ncbi:MAG: hypothetical protein LBN00_09985 [Oscillospiraceae bacterium]|nr:hypothetical protein [Oscillospiraceae bacterium]
MSEATAAVATFAGAVKYATVSNGASVAVTTSGITFITNAPALADGTIHSNGALIWANSVSHLFQINCKISGNTVKVWIVNDAFVTRPTSVNIYAIL